MKELQRRQKIRKALYSLPMLIVLAVLAFFLVRGTVRVLGKQYESSTRASTLKAKAASLAEREKELKEKVTRLKTEEGIKEEIKERFSVTEEGEYVAIIVDEKNKSNSDGSDLPWYKKFWNAIMTRINANGSE